MGKVRGWLLALGALLVVTALACGPPRRAGAVRLGMADADREVALRRGQVLEVSLEANPTTGYRWEVLEVDTHILQPVGEPEFKPESKLMGAPGVETLRFQVVGEGRTTLRLAYRRPWEKDVKPLKTYTVEVVAK